MQWYKKFRTHNNGSLQQAWAFSNDKSTADKLKREKWRFKVLGFGKRKLWLLKKKVFMFQVHWSGTKSSALTIMALSSKLEPLAMANRLQTN